MTNGKREGKGKFYYENGEGGVYDGEWKDGKIDGVGTLYYASGDIAYHGQWKNEQFHGRGLIYNDEPNHENLFDFSNFDTLNEHWIKYEGQFREDSKDGLGTLYLTNGNKFFGIFRDDKVHGKGTYYSKEDETITGEWVDN